MAVDKAVIDVLRQRAKVSDLEVCGALIGRGRDISETIPLDNHSAEPAASFFIDARVVRQLEEEAGRRGAYVAGFYHSHPRGGCRPSPADLAQAAPGYLYVSVSRAGDAAA